jgi:uncharacterized integral membrane protein
MVIPSQIPTRACGQDTRQRRNVTGRERRSSPNVDSSPARRSAQANPQGQEYAAYDVSGEGSDYEGLTGAPPSGVGEVPPRRPPAERRERTRLVAAALLGALVAAFALVNLGDVKVHWIVTTGRTPLIAVIAVAFVLGMLIDRLLLRARRKRRG